MKKFILVAVAVFALGAIRSGLTPDAPTKGIGYHGEAGRSGR